MSSIGSPIDTSLLQAAQAQQQAAKGRDREKAATESARRFQDLVDLRVAGMETAEAVRRLPQNESEQAETEQESKNRLQGYERGEGEGRPRIDVQA
ncbi:MAG: hypothetical protein SYC29_03550 [Planctomycetota bacterium]|nr:hypothetical protein [Planctomycetota bacterium]